MYNISERIRNNNVYKVLLIPRSGLRFLMSFLSLFNVLICILCCLISFIFKDFLYFNQNENGCFDNQRNIMSMLGSLYGIVFIIVVVILPIIYINVVLHNIADTKKRQILILYFVVISFLFSCIQLLLIAFLLRPFVTISNGI